MPVHGFRFYFTPLAGVLFAFPSRYFCAIGSRLVFSLGSWSTRIRTGFLVPRPTQVPHHGERPASRTGLSPSSAQLSGCFRCIRFSATPRVIPMRPYNPGMLRFGLLRVRSPLLAESLLICFPGLLRWFTSPSVAPPDYFIHPCGARYPARVTPFGNPRIKGHVLLPGAYRSLSRPSSPCGSTGIRHGPMLRLTILPSPLPDCSRRRHAQARVRHARPQGAFTSLSFPFPCPVKHHGASGRLIIFSQWDRIELNY